MGRLAVTVAVLFLSSVAFSWASELPEIQASKPVSSSDLPGSSDTIEPLPKPDDSASSTRPENEMRTVESNEEVTTVTFRPADHMLDGQPMMPVSFRFPFRHGRPRRHRGRRPFKPSDLPTLGREVPYGNDMILASEKLGFHSEGSVDRAPWARFRRRCHHHHHSRPEFDEKGQMFRMKWKSDNDDDDDLGHNKKRFNHGHRRFKRDDEEEGHHHHHHHEDDEEDEGGFLMKIRKFLLDRF